MNVSVVIGDFTPRIKRTIKPTALPTFSAPNSDWVHVHYPNSTEEVKQVEWVPVTPEWNEDTTPLTQEVSDCSCDAPTTIDFTDESEETYLYPWQDTVTINDGNHERALDFAAQHGFKGAYDGVPMNSFDAYQKGLEVGLSKARKALVSAQNAFMKLQTQVFESKRFKKCSWYEQNEWYLRSNRVDDVISGELDYIYRTGVKALYRHTPY